MSASNVILHPEAGYAFSDAVGIGQSGEIRFLRSKIAVVPKIGAVVLQRGLGNQTLAAQSWFSRHDSIDDAVSSLPVYLKSALNTVWQLAYYHRHCFENSFTSAELAVEVTIVGWCRRRARPVAWSICSLTWKHPDTIGPRSRTVVPDGTMSEISAISVRPAPAECVSQLLEKPLATTEDVHALDPEIDGLKLLQAQRLLFSERPGMGLVSIVGGFAEMATVTAEGVSVKRIHTWPEDRIGERIRPRVRVKMAAQKRVAELSD
jgi:hypothetical protein